MIRHDFYRRKEKYKGWIKTKSTLQLATSLQTFKYMWGKHRERKERDHSL